MLLPDCAALKHLATPALVVDGAALTHNVETMAAAVAAAGTTLRPHAKTHKTKEIAERQLAAGAVGICCATVTEAEALSAAGIGNLLITSPTFGPDKFARVARLNRQHGVMIVVDHPAQLAGLAAAVATGDRPLCLLVDFDVGQQRTGAIGVPQAVALARQIAANAAFSFSGVQAYAGHAQHIEQADKRTATTTAVASQVRQLAEALSAEGLPPNLITGSGTGTFAQDATGPFTELQAGSYVFMDAEYARVTDSDGRPPDFEPALFVLATVISCNRPGQVTVDAGTKVLATNGPPPDLLLGAPPGSSYRFGGDEHGMITIAPGGTAPALGTRILVRATHCDPTVNLHTSINVFCGDRLEQWAILGRHGQ